MGFLDILTGKQPDQYERGGIVPLVRDIRTKRLQAGVPSALMDLMRAAMTPGDVYQGNVSMYGADGRVSPEIIKRSADLAGGMTLGAGAVPAQANSLRAGIKGLHGTTIDNVPNIKQNWLQPGTSDYTKQFYDDTVDAVFLAEQSDPKRAFSSIRGQIGKKLNKHPADVTEAEIREHGAMIVARPDEYDVYKMRDDGMAENRAGGYLSEYDIPPQAEPGDLFSLSDVKPTGVMKGEILVKYLERHGLLAAVKKFGVGALLAAGVITQQQAAQMQAQGDI